MSTTTDTELEWTEQGAPKSKAFDDIYFNPEDGVAESEYVFLRGCGLPDGWASRDFYCIGETGFGTGLNFFLTWKLWQETHRPGQRLHYVSVERYPLTGQQIEQAISRWPALASVLREFLNDYRIDEPGFHRFHFDRDRVTLTLLVGDAGEVLPELEAVVDAWFLDGFAPSKNPEMWREEVLLELGRLSRSGATLATFTAAGAVRRGLMAAGFDVQKAPGFGRKRERLIAQMGSNNHPSRIPLWYRSDNPESVSPLILGAGVAGLSLYQAFQRRGLEARIVGDEQPATSHNPAANVMPRLEADHGRSSQLMLSAFRYAVRHWQALSLFDQVGALQMATDEKERRRFQKIAERLPQVVDGVTDDDLGQLAGVPLKGYGLWHPKAGLVQGDELLQKYSAQTVQDADGGSEQITIHATGAAPAPTGSGLPFHYFRGHLSCLPVTAGSASLKTTLISGRYLTPVKSAHHWLGATYDRVSTSPKYDAEADDARNLAGLVGEVGHLTSLKADSKRGWVGIRCTLPDRLPVVGPIYQQEQYLSHFSFLGDTERIPKGLEPMESREYGLLGLGSRGFTMAPLAAEILVSQLLQEPWPLPRRLALQLHPARFHVRALKRTQVFEPLY